MLTAILLGLVIAVTISAALFIETKWSMRTLQKGLDEALEQVEEEWEEME